ncbi:2-phospho-L-lactate guanylyltransferase [Georgenia sp. EYE_87]|uniref:2-phospho-L-lactate guanylyltransferase n=1 Tax=Georgenia sp. EYE_87 TaxID=2853448 RepID=UPI0020032165|nr:2-phospho-L-lactate guanylyltransferase [Georgenia sp. EYE_87]
MIAVVPLRGGAAGKTRLSAELGPQERSRLVAVLARHVLGALLDGRVSRVLVVTADPGFAAEVVGHDGRVEVVGQPADRPGLNEAVAVGQERALAAGAARVLVVHADLPLLAADDVRALLEPAAPVVIAPDRLGTGTNALVLAGSVSGFRFRFGPGSREAHEREARRLGVVPDVVLRPGTATDLDTAADWAELPAAVRSGLRAAVGGD